jgi:hypothetical protein
MGHGLLLVLQHHWLDHARRSAGLTPVEREIKECVWTWYRGLDRPTRERVSQLLCAVLDFYVLFLPP